ncbi:plasmid mobilization protein, partial [Acinetobacter baumannii]
TLKPILQAEHWNLNKIDYQLKNSLQYPDPQIEFNPGTVLKSQVEQSQVVQSNQPTQPSIQPKPKNDDYNFDGPGF